MVQGPWGGYRGVGKAGWRGSCRGPLDRSEAFKRAFCRGIAQVLVKATSSTLGAIWASHCSDLLGMLLGTQC